MNVDHKYRICISKVTGRKVIFWCEYDAIWNDSKSFLGKPMYFSNLNTLPYDKVTIFGTEYVNLWKLSTPLIYLQNGALRTLCYLLAPDLMLTSDVPFCRSLCVVPVSNVVETISSRNVYDKLISGQNQLGEKVRRIVAFLGRRCNFGIVGGQALNISPPTNDLDIVVYSDTLSDLSKVLERFWSLNFQTDYLKELWPLSIRHPTWGNIDLFPELSSAPPFFKQLTSCTVLHENFEFTGTITNDELGFLATPTWGIDSSAYMISTDTALKGRLRCGYQVGGIATKTITKDGTVILQIDSSKDIYRRL